jgi:shikimate kinase
MSGGAADVRRIVLIGFMAAGKSTIAPVLAQALGWRVLDVDLAVEAETGETVSSIIRTRGLPVFREMEAELTARLSSGPPVVVAPGGGWVTGPGYDAVRKDAETRTVWLRISIDEAMERAAGDPVERPLLAASREEASKLLAEREPLYAAADHVIDVDGRTADRVVDDILAWLKTNIS